MEMLAVGAQYSYLTLELFCIAVAFRWHNTYNHQFIQISCHPSSEIVLLFICGHIGLMINFTSYLKLVEYKYCSLLAVQLFAGP
jgi:hypothetical protein